MNATLRLPRDQIAALRFEDVQLYLSSHGWQVDAAASSPGVSVYRFPQEPDAEVLLPLRRDWPDYSHRMADAVLTIAAVEQRSFGEVLNDLSSTPGDVLRLRVQAPDAALGTLPLEEGLRLLQGGRDMLLAAACSAHQPQAYFPRQSFAPALEFLQGCRIGQTERGSYVATIIAPVPPDLTPSLFSQMGDEFQLATEPYQRRVTLLWMASLQVIHGAIHSGTPEKILEGVSGGVSANLCDALALMSPTSSQGSVEIRMNWSRNRPRVPASLPQQVSFAQGEFAIIREAGRRLREGLEPRRERIEGVIVSLHAESNLFAPFEGRVVVRTEVDGRPTRVRFALGQADYAHACDAHRDQRRVAVTGVLHRNATSKMVELLRPQNFQVLSASVTAP
jgi:hypothetical protein